MDDKILETTTETTEETAIATSTSTAIETFDSKSIFNADTYDRAIKIAYMYAKAGIAPQAYRNKPADCFVAVSMAMRLGLDPMMVMQNGYIVNGNFSWSGQACYALIEASHKFINLHYVETFKNNTDFSCKLVGTSKETGLQVESDTVDYQMVKNMGWADKAGSYWNKMPRQMARYRSAAFFARAHCPESLMGLYTADEQADISNIYEEDYE